MNNQVMIGNYIRRNGVVIQVDEQTFWDMKTHPEQYDFIPLTEEWLLKFGFEKDYKKGYIGKDFSNQDFVLTEPFVMGEWQKGYAFEFTAGGWPKFKEFNYVHQLQNLCFSLTNQKLIRK